MFHIIFDHKNIQEFATEMLQNITGFSTKILSDDILKRRKNRLNLRHKSGFLIPFVNDVCNAGASLSYLGPKIWDVFLKNFNLTVLRI